MSRISSSSTAESSSVCASPYYNFQYQDGDFMVGDTVMLVIARYETEKKQIFGKILAKW